MRDFEPKVLLPSFLQRVQRVLEEVDPGASHIRVKIQVPVNGRHVESEVLLVLLVQSGPEVLGVLVVEEPLLC